MPADKGVRLNDRQSIANSREQPIETNEYQSVDGTEGEFLWSSPPQDVYLLPQRPNLCLKRSPRPEQIDDRPTNNSAKIPHPTTKLPDSRSTASQARFATGTAAHSPAAPAPMISSGVSAANFSCAVIVTVLIMPRRQVSSRIKIVHCLRAPSGLHRYLPRAGPTMLPSS